MSKIHVKRPGNVFKPYNIESDDTLMIDYEGKLHGFITDPTDNFAISEMIEATLYPSNL